MSTPTKKEKKEDFIYDTKGLETFFSSFMMRIWKNMTFLCFLFVYYTFLLYGIQMRTFDWYKSLCIKVTAQCWNITLSSFFIHTAKQDRCLRFQRVYQSQLWRLSAKMEKSYWQLFLHLVRYNLKLQCRRQIRFSSIFGRCIPYCLYLTYLVVVVIKSFIIVCHKGILLWYNDINLKKCTKEKF